MPAIDRGLLLLSFIGGGGIKQAHKGTEVPECLRPVGPVSGCNPQAVLSGRPIVSRITGI